MEVGVDKYDSEEPRPVARNIEGDICKEDFQDVTESITSTGQSEVSSAEVSKAHEKSENVGSPNPEAKLCGWLHLRTKGIGNLKLIRLRWFVFGDENCKLYYYRDPQDLLPLGEISIENASFYFDAGNTEKPGMFQIKSDGKESLMDAGNRHCMMYWLQTLQTKRREFNLARVSVSTDRVGQWSLQRSNHSGSHIGGLLSKEKEPANTSKFNPDSFGSFPEIHISVGETMNSNTILTSSSKTSSTWALNNLKSEIQSVLSNIKLPSRTREQEGCTFYLDEQKPHGETGTENMGVKDQMSGSSASLNSVSDSGITSDASNNNTTSIPTTTDGQIDADGKGRIGAQILSNSTEKTVAPSAGKNRNDVTLRPNTRRRSKPVSKSPMNSWTIIDKPDKIADEIQAEYMKSVAEKPKNSTDTNRKDTFNTEKAMDGDGVKTGKFLSTFKKMRLGKRQVSEPGGVLMKSFSGSPLICPRCNMATDFDDVWRSKPVVIAAFGGPGISAHTYVVFAKNRFPRHGNRFFAKMTEVWAKVPRPPHSA